MDIMEIVIDSAIYPLSNWPQILVLGFILLLSNIIVIKNINEFLSNINIEVILFLFIIGQIIFLFVRGYLFRIIKFSLTDEMELPPFNDWLGMFIDGIKIFIVSTVYLIPAILILLIVALLSLPLTMGIIGSNPSTFVTDIVLGFGIGSVISILYAIIILPLLLMAIVNMAYGNELGAAFRSREILNKISRIGWTKLIIWYIVTGIIFLIMATIGIFIIVNISLLIQNMGQNVGQILIMLILIPYLLIYSARSTALIYKS